MSFASALAAIAALLACAGAHELLAARSAAGRAPRIVFGGRRAAKAALRLGLPERIARAGFENSLTVTSVLLAKLASGAVAAIVAMAVAPSAPGRASVLVFLGVPAAGFLVPDALLERRARLRSRRLLGALPDACDLLAVATASGRSPAVGLAELAGAGDGPLAAQLRMTVAELSCGAPLSEALRSLRARVPGNEIAALCAAIERSRRFGSPLADQLRRHSSALRRDQRRAIEDRAARAAPKIQLVVALVLVPSVLLMIAAALIANADVLLGGF